LRRPGREAGIPLITLVGDHRFEPGGSALCGRGGVGAALLNPGVQILSNVLPGLRELRGPLAAGYLWMAFVVVIVVDRLPLVPAAGSSFDKLYVVARWVGAPVAIAVATFIAYVVGILSTALTDLILTRVSERHRRTVDEAEVLQRRTPALSARGLKAVTTAVEERIAQQLADRNGQPYVIASNSYPEAKAVLLALSSAIELTERRQLVASAVETGPHVRAVLDDLVLVPNRLLGKEPEKHAFYDRLRSEGEFRAALTVPLVAVGVAISARQHAALPALTALALAALLFMQARSRVVGANDQLADFLRSGSLNSPGMSQIEQFSIRFVRMGLSLAELRSFATRASTAESKGQLEGAISFYTVIAAAGSGRAFEHLCDLTLAQKSIYRDVDVFMEPLLLEGNEHSGRLSLEALDLLISRGTRPLDPPPDNPDEWARGMRWAVDLASLRAFTHEQSRPLADVILSVTYRGERGETGFEADLSLVAERAMQPAAFLAKYIPPTGWCPTELIPLLPAIRAAVAKIRHASSRVAPFVLSDAELLGVAADPV